MSDTLEIIHFTSGGILGTSIRDFTFVKPVIDDLVIEGRNTYSLFGEALQDATFETTINGASSVTMSIFDSDGKIMRSEIAKQASSLLVSDHNFKLVKVAKQGRNLTLTFEEAAVYWLRKYDSYLKQRRSLQNRAEFIRRMVWEVTQIPIPFYAPEVLKKQAEVVPKQLRHPPKSQRQQKIRQNKRTHGPGITKDEGIKIQKQDADSEQIRNCNIALDVGDQMNASHRVLMSAIEAGIQESFMRNLSYGSGSSIGILQNIAGNGTDSQRRDVRWVFRHYYEEAIGWARAHPGRGPHEIADAVQRPAGRDPTVYGQWQGEAQAILEAYGSGPGGEATGSAATGKDFVKKPYYFERGAHGKKENSWQASGRLADQVQWRRFVAAGTFTFISDQALMTAQSWFVLDENTATVESIDFDIDGGKKAAAATIQTSLAQWTVFPGNIVELKNMGQADGKWIVETVNGSFFDDRGTVTLTRPRKKLKEPAADVKELPQAAGGPYGPINFSRGARSIVDQLARVAILSGLDAEIGGHNPGRPRLADGSIDAHTRNDKTMAARDIGQSGVNMITGPPPPALDKAAVAIGAALDRPKSYYRYGYQVKAPGHDTDTFWTHNYRIQVIYRTPLYGGHMGHIHVDARHFGYGLASGQRRGR